MLFFDETVSTCILSHKVLFNWTRLSQKFLWHKLPITIHIYLWIFWYGNSFTYDHLMRLRFFKVYSSYRIIQQLLYYKIIHLNDVMIAIGSFILKLQRYHVTPYKNCFYHKFLINIGRICELDEWRHIT